jgi:uncharacterized protein (TIGR02217 family)
MPAAFHEARFPLAVALGATGGPERRTEIVELASGREERNARWAHSRRAYDAAPGVRSLSDLRAVIAFFEERRGRLHGFRFRDPVDHASAETVTPLDQALGTGDGVRLGFQLQKTYGAGATAYVRPIAKPVAGTARVAVAGLERAVGPEVSVDWASGTVLFPVGQAPPAGAPVTAGFEFDVPVRFDADRLEVSLTAFRAGEIGRIPLIEIVP